jgi:BirA family transcriptional regulator, biotin operon repressor / biotin---[acetyl-CoA-carboxylase] ligase
MPLDLEELERRLPGRDFRYLPRIGSTMTAAQQAVREGCPSGTVLIAEEQTQGKGRLGRAWHSEPGTGLYFSEVLRLSLPGTLWPVLTMAVGLAVAEAIEQVAGLRCDLRWPNDVLIGARKCAGILVATEAAAIVLGIGINVNHRGFPPELAETATSLYLATGREHRREDLLTHLLPAIDTLCALLEQRGSRPILDLFSRQSSFVSGRRVVVEHNEGTLRGITDGLDESGFLRLRLENGSRTLIIAGGVRPDPEAGAVLA